MTLSDVSPSDAVSGDSEATSGDAGDGSDASSEAAGGRATSPSDVLMSTRPDLAADDVQEQTGLDLAGAHVLIMVRKMIAALVPSTDDDGGLPAIGNGVLAAYHWLLGESQDDAGEDDDGGGSADDAAESEASFRSVDDSEEISVETRPDYHDPATGGATA